MTNSEGIVSAFIATRKLRNLSPNMIEFYSKIYNKFLAFMQASYPDVPIDQIDHFMLREYILELKNHYSLGGMNYHIKVLKILFKFMVGEELVSENPTKKSLNLGMSKL
jgi:site-specific recombinase XerD